MTFQKNDQGKLKYTLLPPRALARVVEVLGKGAEKYGANNFLKATSADEHRYLDAVYRHLEACRLEEWNDPETHLPHLAHAICSLLFLLELGVLDVD